MAAAGTNRLTLMEYIGANVGNTDWHAPSGMTYRFGGNRRLGYVDARDVEWLLNVRVGGRPQFRRYIPPVNSNIQVVEAAEEKTIVASAAETVTAPVAETVMADVAETGTAAMVNEADIAERPVKRGRGRPRRNG